ncbi:hypothetical protein PWG71_14405 [Nocardiopsis sp. N85]|uniref:hypothetical protein n=1 Tax=Nocardiopsis sp. N85 TaxID=3029400 RepID=UPI00237F5010|nr:hypothetical protein [Nocardiopsis sp. N85]MDE3722580.1 hypothetical protein [Nocardiopsis sp. N85]
MTQDDILDAVSALEPGAVRERAEHLSHLHRERVLERARAAGGRRAFLRATADRRWRLPVTVGALATAAAVGAGIFMYSPQTIIVPGGPADVQGGTAQAPAYADAREVFIAAAEAAAAEETAVGDVWYIRTHNRRPAGPVGGGSDYTVHQTFTEEQWYELGGDFRSLNNLNLNAENIFPTEEDRAAWEEAGSPDLNHSTPASTGYHGEFVNIIDSRTSELLELPGDPEELETLLRERWSASLSLTDSPVPETEAEFDSYVLSVFPDLVTGALRSETRGAFFALAAEAEGIELVGPAQDQLGRPGQRLKVTDPSIPDADLSFHWIVDPESGTLLSTQMDEQVWVTYEQVGFVEEIGEAAVPVEYENRYGN